MIDSNTSTQGLQVMGTYWVWQVSGAMLSQDHGIPLTRLKKRFRCAITSSRDSSSEVIRDGSLRPKYSYLAMQRNYRGWMRLLMKLKATPMLVRPSFLRR